MKETEKTHTCLFQSYSLHAAARISIKFATAHVNCVCLNGFN